MKLSFFKLGGPLLLIYASCLTSVSLEANQDGYLPLLFNKSNIFNIRERDSYSNASATNKNKVHIYTYLILDHIPACLSEICVEQFNYYNKVFTHVDYDSRRVTLGKLVCKRSKRQQGSVRKRLRLAELYLSGYGTEVDTNKALCLFEAVASRKIPYAEYMTSKLLLQKGIREEHAISFLKRAANHHFYPDAMFDLGLLYYQGKHVEKDLDLATKWLSKAFTLEESKMAQVLTNPETEASALAILYREIRKNGGRNPIHLRQLIPLKKENGIKSVSFEDFLELDMEYLERPRKNKSKNYYSYIEQETSE